MIDTYYVGITNDDVHLFQSEGKINNFQYIIINKIIIHVCV